MEDCLQVDAARQRLGGRFGLCQFRAKPVPTPFGTHRAFTRALPRSLAFVSSLPPFLPATGA